MARFEIHEDIQQAHSLPSGFYKDPEVFSQFRNKIFPASWQWAASSDAVRENGSAFPFRLLDPFLGEPLLLTRNLSGELHCLSNVCTHRGNLLIQKSGNCNEIKCNYHGRRFSLEGKFESMPGFETAQNFPSTEDHLPQLPIFTFGKFLFTSLRPPFQPAFLFGEMIRRAGFLPFEKFVLDSTKSRDYLLDANWLLYVENHLECLHQPFVHAGLQAAMNADTVRTELFPWSILQTGFANTGQPVFDFPQGHPDFGKEIAAYFFWLFPNTFLNFYPWGLTVCIVHPLEMDKTRIRFFTYVWKPEVLAKMKLYSPETVELEDHFLIQSNHQGLRGELFRTGRYSPTKETGLHHFHRMLATLIS